MPNFGNSGSMYIGEYFRDCDRGHGHGRSDRALNGNDHTTASGCGDLECPCPSPLD